MLAFTFDLSSRILLYFYLILQIAVKYPQKARAFVNVRYFLLANESKLHQRATSFSSDERKFPLLLKFRGEGGRTEVVKLEFEVVKFREFCCEANLAFENVETQVLFIRQIWR